MGLTKAVIRNKDFQNEKIDCAFNPNEYTIAKMNRWGYSTVQGKEVPQFGFQGGEPRNLTMELFFDVYERQGGDVRDDVNKLWKLTKIDRRLKNDKYQQGRPPLVSFEWGSQWEFTAAITNLSVRYTLFRQDGTPVRATATVTFQEALDDNDQPLTNPTSHSNQAGLKRREVRPHDTLALIAHEEYGDCTRWRLIADANDIQDPLSLTAGDIIAIPPLS